MKSKNKKGNLGSIWVAFSMLLVSGCGIVEGGSGETLSHVYAGHFTACTVDSDADIATANRIQLVAGELYKIYCFDPVANDGIKCRCLAGDVTVDASAVESPFIPANAQEYWIFANNLEYLSCQVYADDVEIHACKKR